MSKISKRNNKRVFVGLSGGVDSAVAAALLKKQGYDVAGVFMRFWRPRTNADLETADERGKNSSSADKRGWENSCCSAESQANALAVAQKLGIPFYVFNFEREFKKAVVDYFLRELQAGRTPNPCVTCNPEIKFGLFLDKAKKLGADYISTGHYARVSLCHPEERSDEGSLANARPDIKSEIPRFARNDKSYLYKLFSAKDKQKDQSYFLHRLTQEQLSRVLFPLAGYTKAEVYKLAKQWRLPHQAHQSFDICFAGDYPGFLKNHLKLKEGKIISLSVIPARLDSARLAKAGIQAQNTEPGSPIKSGMTKEVVLGAHQGLPFYTIGQRASVGGPGPFFVVKKDVKRNILYVSNNECDLYQREMLVEKVNWSAGEAPRLPLRCKIRIRYGAKSEYALISSFARGYGRTKRTNGSIKNLRVLFDKPQRAITSGQSAVFYGRGGEVLGGGMIV